MQRYPEAPVRDAATVIVARDGEHGVEVFLVTRHAKSSFLAMRAVYPGGALDEADCLDDTRALFEPPWSDEAMAARLEDDTLGPTRARGLYVAAARETFEESGLLLARQPDSTQWIDHERLGDVAEARERVHRHPEQFARLIAEHDLRLDPGQMGYFARWITPDSEPIRFDAHFFVVRAPSRQLASHDQSETIQSHWYRPSECLADYARGELLMAPPTLSTLQRVGQFDRVDALLEYARTHRPATILPHTTPREGGGGRITLPTDPHDPRHAAFDPATRDRWPQWTRMSVVGDPRIHQWRAEETPKS